MPENQKDIKPKNLKLHDFLVRKMAVKMMLSEEIIDKVISHEKKGINDAFKKHQEVEISGFGKFFLSQVKLKKKITTFEKTLITLEKRLIDDPGNPDTVAKIKSISEEIIYLKSKMR